MVYLPTKTQHLSGSVGTLLKGSNRALQLPRGTQEPYSHTTIRLQVSATQEQNCSSASAEHIVLQQHLIVSGSADSKQFARGRRFHKCWPLQTTDWGRQQRTLLVISVTDAPFLHCESGAVW